MRRVADEPMDRSPPRIARGGWLDAAPLHCRGADHRLPFSRGGAGPAAPVPSGVRPRLSANRLLHHRFPATSWPASTATGWLPGRRRWAPMSAQRLLRVIPAHLVVSLILIRHRRRRRIGRRLPKQSAVVRLVATARRSCSLSRPMACRAGRAGTPRPGPSRP